MRPRFLRWRLTRLASRAGVSLTELMVAVAVMSIGVLGLLGSLAAIQKSIQLSKSKTLASNLAQEKLHIVMQQPYYQIIPTPNPSGEETGYTPTIPYDTAYFPPETILQGGISYRRLTYIQTVKEDSGELELLPPETPDTGMRLITVTVLWTEGGEKKKLQLTSAISNPDTVMSNAILTGKVQINGTSTGIQDALVTVAENVGWRDTTNGSGTYSINVSPGAVSLVVTAQGYQTKYVPVTALANQSVTTNIDMVAVSSGIVAGTAWLNPNLLISQVVASTVMADTGFTVQYVELFNPTENTVDIGGDPPDVRLNYQTACTGSVTCTHATYGIKLVYVNDGVGPHKYYVVANTPTFTVNGATVTADAYFDNNAHSYCAVPPNGGVWNAPSIKQILTIGHGGSLWLTNAAGTVLDSVGLMHNGVALPRYEGTYLDLGATGMVDSMQIVRVSSPSWLHAAYGRAYDYGSNVVDFTTATLQYPVFSTQSSSVTIVAGVPAIGGVISATDGLSDPTTAYSSGWPPKAVFRLNSVATGTWTVMLSSRAFKMQETDSVTISSAGSTYVFPSSTTLLDEDASVGFISGRVTNVGGSALSGIVMSPGANGPTVTTNGSGRYLLQVSTGMVDVTANYNNSNASYVSMSSSNISIGLGQVANGVDFTLSQGGRISGFVTRDGSNALAGIAIAAIDANGSARDLQVSDSNGRFTTLNIATGTYEVTPTVDSLETSSPTYNSVTVTAGATVFGGTFTVTGALGTISGTVTSGGSIIATGVLVVVTTKTLSGTPPVPPSLSTATLSDAAYYIASSREDGTYSVDVRGSTNPVYNVYGYYYPTTGMGSSASSYRTRTAAVLAGSTTAQIDLAW